MICKNTTISQGIAWGKATFLTTLDFKSEVSNHFNQEQIFLQAIDSVNRDINQEIIEADYQYGSRISEIFQSHKFIVNDPLIIDPTLQKIKAGFSAFDAYQSTVKSILNDFQKITNEYILGRVVDILDATDKVKVALEGIKPTVISNHSENNILILKELKPSIIYQCKKYHVKGFVCSEGMYMQHSGIIAHEIKIPGMVCPDIFQRVKANDFIIIDANEGDIFINPNQDIINKFIKEVTQ